MRLSPERLAKVLEQEKTISPADYEKVKGLANMSARYAALFLKRPTNTVWHIKI